jgi:hypothetical protein
VAEVARTRGRAAELELEARPGGTSVGAEVVDRAARAQQALVSPVAVHPDLAHDVLLACGVFRPGGDRHEAVGT